MRYTKNAYADGDISALAEAIVAYIADGLDATDFLGVVAERYAQVWNSALPGKGIQRRTFGEDDKLRMKFESIYYTVLLVGLYMADEYVWKKGLLLSKPDPKAAHALKMKSLPAFANYLNANGFNGLREWEVVELEPEIKWKLGRNIDLQRRFHEYMDAHQEKPGGELQVFGKYMARAIDATNYPFHQIWVMEFGEPLLSHAKESVLSSMASLGFVK